jgi:NAD(P)-dependent dehydrogenase (short-subunit alcohol dehydrogenase family)
MSIPNFSLSGQRALVTGGRRGIGRSIALTFAEAGADVAVCDLVIDDGQLEGVAEEIQKHGRRSLAIQADTSRKVDVENMVQRTVKEFGSIDILVNNAGIVATGPFLDLSEEEWDRVVSVNLKGYYLCAQTVAKRMVEPKKGSIVNIASEAAFKAVPGMGVYCVSKAGVVMLTRVLARELGGYGIRANAIAPGIVKTEMSRYDWENTEFRRQREAEIPLGRLAETSDLVGIALFLASDASNYITGNIVLVDGGQMA